ncbi:hypothetical protein [Streptomyces platensis]|uniref:hypothetical protein n=1 Tax=Streptomyces platensis TaxID=58346 RepID=UPI00387087DD|nr:hypothetical protein OG962_37275 [Streptomyces platensis]
MSDTPIPDFSGLDGGGEQQATDIVRDVVSWYNTQLAAERRAPVPDEDRIEELKAARQTAIDDQQRLETADPQETARIAALYAARLKELNES